MDMTKVESALRFLAACAVTAVLCIPVGAGRAEAAASSVVYDGGARSFVFVPESTDLFGNFKGIMPGDVLEQEIAVGNAQGGVPVKLYLRAESADVRSAKLLRSLTIRVGLEGAGTLFDAPANEPGGLADWTYLGTVAPGDSAKLLVSLVVPTSLGDEFQFASGKVVWTFKAEEAPVASPEREAGSAPRTGDDMVLPVGAAVAVAVVAGGTVAFARRRARR